MSQCSVGSVNRFAPRRISVSCSAQRRPSEGFGPSAFQRPLSWAPPTCPCTNIAQSYAALEIRVAQIFCRNLCNSILQEILCAVCRDILGTEAIPAACAQDTAPMCLCADFWCLTARGGPDRHGGDSKAHGRCTAQVVVAKACAHHVVHKIRCIASIAHILCAARSTRRIAIIADVANHRRAPLAPSPFLPPSQAQSCQGPTIQTSPRPGGSRLCRRTAIMRSSSTQTVAATKATESGMPNGRRPAKGRFLDGSS